MKRLLRYLSIFAIALGIVIVITLIAASFYIGTEDFRERVRKELVASINETFPAELSLAKIEGSIWNDLVITELVVRHQGKQILRVPRMTADYALSSLLGGTLRLNEVQVFEPVAHLKRDDRGHWNLLEAFASPSEEEKEGAGFTLAVLLERLSLQGGQIDLSLANDDKDEHYRLADVNLDGSLAVLASGLEANVRHLTARISSTGFPPLQLKASLGYQGADKPARVEVNKLDLATEKSLVRVNGEVRDLDALETQATVAIEKLAAADLAQIISDSPLKQDLSGEVEIYGSLMELKAKVLLSGADARLAGNLQADLSGKVPQFKGVVELSRIDIQKLFALGEKLAGVVNGNIRVNGEGTSLQGLQAQTDFKIDGLRVEHWQLGTASLQGNLVDQKVKLTGDLRGEIGQASWQGHLDLAKVPSYELSTSVQHLDVRRVTPNETSIAGDLNLKAAVKGKGLAVNDMHTRAQVELLPSTVGSIAIQRGRLDAKIANGRIRIAEGNINTSDARLRVQGEIGVSPDAPGRVTYDLKVGNLSPWLALAGQQGSGALSLAGQARGSLSHLALQGALQATGLNLEGVSLERASLDYDLDGIGDKWPQGSLSAELTDLKAGVVLQRVDAKVALPPGKSQLARIIVNAQERKARTHRLQAEVRYGPERITTRLSQLVFALPDGEWRLASPAEIAYSADQISVERLLLAHRDQRLLLDGALSSAGPQDLKVQLERLDLAALASLLPGEPKLAGLLSARFQIGGTAAAPAITGTTEIDQPKLGGQAFHGLAAKLDYRRQRAVLDFTFQQDRSHALTAAGVLPLALSWANKWQASALGNMDINVRSKGLNLAFLNTFAGEAVHDIEGSLTMDLRITGAVSRPQPSGTVQLLNGKAAVEALGVQFDALDLEAVVTPEQLRIQRLFARAREGEIHGRGNIALLDYIPETLTVSLTANRWPAIWTKQYKAEIDAQLNAKGTIAAPELGGWIEVRRARLRPDLAFLEDKPVSPRDETIVVVGGKEYYTKPTQRKKEEPLATAALENLALDLTVRLRRDIQVRHPNAKLELAGEVRARKSRGEEPNLVGSIHIVHGWAGFQGRRFTVDGGKVVFTGGQKIDPSLNIVGQHRFPNYLVEAIVGGTVEKPTLALRSQPPLEQADILALLLFGKPASALLERGEQVDLQRQALALTGSYAAATIGQSVSEALGLEELGIDISELDFSGGQVGLDRYITPNTRISVSQDIGGKQGQEVSIEYQIAPGWEAHTSTSSSGNSGADIIWRKQY
jgi:Uncharacterized protein conserved in bacteria